MYAVTPLGGYDYAVTVGRETIKGPAAAMVLGK